MAPVCTCLGSSPSAASGSDGQTLWYPENQGPPWLPGSPQSPGGWRGPVMSSPVPSAYAHKTCSNEKHLSVRCLRVHRDSAAFMAPRVPGSVPGAKAGEQRSTQAEGKP